MPQMPAQGKKRARGGGERVSKAPKMRRSCDACACAKRKCDGETRCSLCTKKGIPCVYSERQKSGPKGNHTPGPAKQAAAESTADGALADKGGKSDQKRPAAAAGGPKPKKRVVDGGIAPAAAATAAATATATATAGAKTIGWQQQEQKKHLSPSPLTPKPETPRPSPPVAPIVAASPRSSPASSSPAGSPPTDKPATVRPRQKQRAVAKKEPRPRHKLKNQDGGKGTDPTAAPAVVSPVGYPSAAATDGGDGARMPVAPPLPPRLSLSSSKAAAAAAVPSPVKDDTPPLSSMLLHDDMLPTAVSASGSSTDGASSSLSWDDVPDVFVSSLEDDVLWSCDDLSDDGTSGGGSVGAEGDEKPFPAAGFAAGLARGEKMRTVERTVSPTVEMMLLDDPPAPTTSRFAGGFGISHQLHRPESSPMLLKSTPSPVLVSPRQPAALPESSSRHQQPIEVDEPIVMGVLPAVSRRTSTSSASSTGTDIGRRQNSFRSIPEDVTSSPISSWTQDAVEAGASTLLAVLADTDFCGAAVGRGVDRVTGAGGGHGGLQKQQNHPQQHRFHLNQYRHNQQRPHRPRADIRSGSTTTIDAHNARVSLRWPPQGTSVSHGRAAHFAMGSRLSPPASTPSATATAAFAPVGSRPWHHHTPTSAAAAPHQRHGIHHQQRSQPQGGPVSTDGRRLAEGMSAGSKGAWAARGERSGSKAYQTASL